MTTENISAGESRRHLNAQFHGIAMRPLERRLAEASMHSADQITDAILVLSSAVSQACQTLVSAPARTFTEKCMESAEHVARAIIKMVDATQRRWNERC